MDKHELSFKSSWLYEFDNFECIKEYRNIVHCYDVNDVSLFRLTRVRIQNYFSLDDIKNALEEGEESKALEIIKSMSEKQANEEYCELLIFNKLKLICIVTNKISHWKEFINNTNLKKLNYVNKDLIMNLINTNFTDNILNVTYAYKKFESMIDAINIYGSEIQSSTEFKELIKDTEREIIDITFQPEKYKFLVTLRSNKLKVSKYASGEEFFILLIEFIYSIGKMVKRYEDN